MEQRRSNSEVEKPALSTSKGSAVALYRTSKYAGLRALADILPLETPYRAPASVCVAAISGCG